MERENDKKSCQNILTNKVVNDILKMTRKVVKSIDVKNRKNKKDRKNKKSK